MYVGIPPPQQQCTSSIYYISGLPPMILYISIFIYRIPMFSRMYIARSWLLIVTLHLYLFLLFLYPLQFRFSPLKPDVLVDYLSWILFTSATISLSSVILYNTCTRAMFDGISYPVMNYFLYSTLFSSCLMCVKQVSTNYP